MAVTKKGLQTHQNFLRKLIRDDRLQPSRRMLAEMILLYMEGHIPFAFIEGIYGNSGRIKWNGENGEGPEPVDDKINREAKDFLREMFGGAANDQSGTPSNTTGS